MNLLKEITLLAGTFLPSPLRLATWRLCGFKVGRGCHVSMLSIVVADRIELGAGAVIEPLSLIYRPQLLSIGERARIAGFVRIIGHEGIVRLHRQSFVGLGCLVDCTAGFELGDRSQLGPRSTVYSHGGSQLLYNMRYPHRFGPVLIGSDSWIGMGCIVHPGIKIGDRAIVLPGLVVRAEVKSDTSLVALQLEHRVISTKRLLLGLPADEQQHKIDGLLRLLARQMRGSRLDESNEESWRLELSGGNTIHLLRQPGARIAPGLVNSRAIIWTLLPSGIVAGATNFCFERLAVCGPWTPFSEEVAAFLCRSGAQFVFDDISSATAGATTP